MTGEVPGAAAQVFARAEALRDLGRPAEALGLVRQGLASDPHDVTLLVLATTLSLALEDYAQAADFATQAAAQAPGWALPLALLAQARRLADDPAGGKQAAQAALHLDPDELTNPWAAAWASLFAFTLGALVPVLAILLPGPSWRGPVTVAAVVLALALTGYASARMGEANPGRAVLRNVGGGLLAMGITFAVGSLVGTGIG